MTPESRLRMSLAHKGKTSSHLGHKHSEETRRQMSVSHSVPRPWMKGKKPSPETIKKFREAKIGVPQTESHIKAAAKATRLAMRRPDVRERHLQALHRTQWIKVKTDHGQLEWIEKWNRLGFKFEPNYQFLTATDLFYIDGYDPIHNVVLEYDGKYHQRTHQKNKDLARQKKIIDALRPKKFWRYDSVNKWVYNVL